MTATQADFCGSLMVGLDGPELTSSDRRRLAHPAVGAVCLFARNYENAQGLTKLVAQARACVSKPLLIAVDQEGGRVQRFRGRGFPKLEPARTLGERYRHDAGGAIEEAVERGAAISRQLANVGIDLSLVPVLDIDYGRNKMIGERCFSDDPAAVAALALAFCQGLAENGMKAVGKHFPGHGWAAADSHLEIPVDDRSPDAIRDSDLLPYKILIDAGLLSAVLISHVCYKQIDAVPATYSSEVIVGELRDGLGFDGLVMTDDLVMEGANIGLGIVERTLRSRESGCDLHLWCGGEPVLLDSALERIPASDEGCSPWQMLKRLGN